MTKLNPNEADVKKAVRKALADHGWFAWAPPANMYGANGQSDILALKAGVFLAIETKYKKASGTVNQETFMQNVKAHGGLAVLVNKTNLPAFIAWLPSVSNGGQ